MYKETKTGNKIKITFLCTANSCRSQMAEGFARHLGGDIFEAYSAGLFSHYVQPRAIEVMNEAGIDISGQKSEAVDYDVLRSMDILITLCDHADASCPATPPHIRRIHWPIKDPVGATGTEEEIMDDFRRARDEIRFKIVELIDNIKARSS
jgi:arsenate reductase